ncbi:MAG: DUF2189 domain-containing protein [Burkholderiaceae bacterium]|jgi:uncharacterized membrane protein
MIAVSANLPLTSAFRWLKQGWSEFMCSGMRGAYYGAFFALMGYAISYIYGSFWQATMGITAGFFLMGPFICCGVYDLSRQRERGEPQSLVKSWFGWTRNWKSIAFFAAMLTFFMIIWARVSVVIFALFASHDYPTLQSMLAQIVSVENLEFLLVWAGVGFVFASIVFAISVVSVPLLLDRDADTMMAVFASVRALWANPGTCLVWGLCIVVLIGGSLVLFMPLLIITAPWVGHATWAAYKTMVGEDNEETYKPLI